MNSTKKKRLEAAGCKLGTPAEFLKLTKKEAADVEGKLRPLLKSRKPIKT